MSKKTISSLNVILGGTVAPFVKAFSGAGAAVTGLTGKLGTLSAGLAKWTGISGAISGLLGGAGIGVLVEQQMKAIDVNAKLSDRMGISTEALAGFQHAADLAGISSEDLTGGLGHMLKNIGKAAVDGGDLATSLKDIGLDAMSLAKMKPEQAFTTIAEALKNIKNPALRAKAATDIFGKSGQSLLPLMMSGAEGIKAAMKEAEALGLTFNRVDAAKVEEANDAFTRVKATIVGVGRSLAITLVPSLKAIADSATELGKKLVAGVKNAAPMIQSAIAFIGSLISNGVALYSKYISMVTGVFRKVFGGIYAIVAPAVMAAVRFIAAVWPQITAVVQSVASTVWSVITAAWGQIYSFLSSVLSTIGSNIASNWQGYLATVVSVGAGIWGFIVDVFTGVVSFIGQAWIAIGTVFNAGASVISTVWGGIATVTGWGSNLVSTQINGAASSSSAAFDSMGQRGRGFADAIRDVMTIAGFAISHWKDGVELMGTNVAYFIVRLGNQIQYVFTQVIPAVFTYAAGQVKDFASYTGTVFSNIGSNIWNLFKNLPGLIKGTVKFDDIWTPLETGFKSTAKALAVPDREIGGLEAELKSQAKELGDKWADGLFDAMNASDRKAKNATDGITDTIKKGIEAINPPVIPPPTIDPPVIPTPTPPPMPTLSFDTDTSGLDAINRKAKDTAKNILVLANSAESMQLRAQAAFAALTTPGRPSPSTVPNNDNSLAQGNVGGLTRTAPINRAVAAAAKAREAKDKADNTGMIDVLLKILAEMKGQDRIEFMEGAV